MISKLQGQNWKQIVKSLKDVGAPTTAKQIGLKSEVVYNLDKFGLRFNDLSNLKDSKILNKNAEAQLL